MPPAPTSRWGLVTRDESVAALRRSGFLPAPLPGMPDVPDGQLASAVIAYQAFHGIFAETGFVGPRTVRSLAAPRCCAHPDAMPLPGDHKDRWPYREVSWCVDPAARFAGLSPADIRQAFDWAWGRWAAVCGLQPSYNPNPKTADVVASTGPLDGPGGVLALTVMANGDPGPSHNGISHPQTFDEAEAWSTAPGPYEIELARCVCHEVGHAIGIPHLAAGNLMQPVYSAAIRVPQSGDIDQAVSRYGPADGAAVPHVAHPEVVVTLRIDGRLVGADIPGFRITPLA